MPSKISYLAVGFSLLVMAPPSPAAESIDQLDAAIRTNDLRGLRALIAQGTSPNASDSHQITALMYAAAYGSIDSMRILLEAGADANAPNALGSTALFWAVTDAAKVRLLLDHGAGVNQTAKSGFTPLISAALKDPSAEVARMLLQEGADAKATNPTGMTALNAATKGNDIETIRIIVDAGVDVNAATTDGTTPLMNASANGNLDAVRLLIAKGARVNQSTSRDKLIRVKNGVVPTGGRTALMMASVFGPSELVKVLLDAGAEANAEDMRGMTPLMFAVGTDHQDPGTIRWLLAYGGSLEKKSLAGETARDWAQKVGARGAIESLGSPPQPRAAAVPASSPLPNLRDALQRSIGLLETSSVEYFHQSGCPGCHAQIITSIAVAAARTKGIRVNEDSARERLRQLTSPVNAIGPALLEGRDPINITLEGMLYSLEAMAQSSYGTDGVTDVLAAAVAAQQRSDGRWHRGGSARTPITDGDLTTTALGIRALKKYGTTGRDLETDRRIDRARQWLLDARPVTTQDYDMRLVGVATAGARTSVLKRLAQPILSRQRADGGWAQRDEMQSDAYGTGMTLWALAEAGILQPGDPQYQRGMRFLLSTQHADGSWYVATRAVKVQPYFEGGFPYGDDQWISSMATGWAATALARGVK